MRKIEKKLKVQKDLFGEKVPEKAINKIEDHWIDMPTYDNAPREKPQIVALFKFRNEKDYKKFTNLVKKYLYDGEPVFQGPALRGNVRTTWYPHFEKAGNFEYTDEIDEILENIDEALDYEDD